jgi:hypothetical protein
MTVTNGSYAIVRQDKPPQEWWDGYYSGLPLSKDMAEYWSKELGVPCYAMVASWPVLPDSGFHATRKAVSR